MEATIAPRSQCKPHINLSTCMYNIYCIYVYFEKLFVCKS